MVDPASNVLSYLYDDRGLLTKVLVGESTQGTYYYDDAGRRTRLLLGNSSYAYYLYDDANRLTLLSNRKSDSSTISSFTYRVDKTGNRTRLTLSSGNYLDFLYDDTYQLTREHRRDSGDATLYYNNFYYDPAGNRTRLEYNDGTSTTTTSYLYNSADQLTRESVGETNTTYLYDANGNLTKKDDGTNVSSYAYDFRNLLTSYDGPGSSNDTTYKYDAGDRRITKDVNGTKTAYFHDGLDVVAEYNGSDQLQRTYVTPGLDQNLSMTASGSTYYYTSDGLGSIRNLLDSSEVAQNTYDYFAFGSVYGSPTENITQPVRYTGRSWDVESGSYHHRARLYLAEQGRFLARDPLPGPSGHSLYVYVSNRPLLLTDPTGLMSKEECESEVDEVEEEAKKGQPSSSAGRYVHKGRMLRRKGFLGSTSCLKDIKCECCLFPVAGAYNPLSQTVSICYNRLLAGEVEDVVGHEAVHSLDFCGEWLIDCLSALKAEAKAYYLFGAGNAQTACESGWGSAKHYACAFRSKADRQRYIDQCKKWFDSDLGPPKLGDYAPTGIDVPWAE